MQIFADMSSFFEDITIVLSYLFVLIKCKNGLPYIRPWNMPFGVQCGLTSSALSTRGSRLLTDHACDGGGLGSDGRAHVFPTLHSVDIIHIQLRNRQISHALQ